MVKLRAGDVLEIPGGKRAGRYVVAKQWRGSDPPRLVAVSDRGKVVQLREADLSVGTKRVGMVQLPKRFQLRDARYQQSIASTLRDFQPTHAEMIDSGPVDGAERHPVASCPKRLSHERAGRLLGHAQRELTRLRHQLVLEGEGLVAEFRAILDLLGEWRYLDDWSLTEEGEGLRRIYNELDLLVAETIAGGGFEGLDGAETAALASCFVYEPRSDLGEAGLPTVRLERRWSDLLLRFERLQKAERRRRLPETREPNSGFADIVFAWAHGEELDALLGEDDFAAGDFVRTCRQLLDLLRQLRDAEPSLREQVALAIRMLDRGVVAAEGMM